MATRSTVTLHPAGHYRKIHLYRHWDGGPWGNGSSLAKLLRKPNWRAFDARGTERQAMHFAESLIRLSDRTGRGMYELTTDAENHGDTEWHYDVFFTADGEAPAVRVKCRKWSNDKGWEYQLGGDVRMFRSYLAQWMRGMLLTVRANRAQRAMLTL